MSTFPNMPDLQIIQEAIDPLHFKHNGLPTDVHIISFIKDGKTQHDAVRAVAMADIFDHYFDQLKDSTKIIAIKSGYGNIRPNLYGRIKPAEEGGNDRPMLKGLSDNEDR